MKTKDGQTWDIAVVKLVFVISNTCFKQIFSHFKIYKMTLFVHFYLESPKVTNRMLRLDAYSRLLNHKTKFKQRFS